MLTAAFVARQRSAAAPDGREHADRVDVSNHAIKAQVGLARRISPHRAGIAIGLARVLTEEMPHTLNALWSGRLNEWRATILARETAVLKREHRAIVDERLCCDPATIVGWGDRELGRRAAALGYALDAESAVRRRKLAVTQRHVSLRSAPDQMTWLTALLPLADGVAVWKSLGCVADGAKASGDARSRGQIMADTLTSHVLTGGSPGGRGLSGDGPSARPAGSSAAWIGDAGSPVGPDPTRWFPDGVSTAWSGVQAPVPPPVPIKLHLTLPATGLLAGGGVGWLEGEPMTALDAVEMLAAAPVEIRRVFTDPAGKLVAMESSARFFPDGLAELIRVRDRGCATPWCDAPIRQSDHVVPDARGGTTSFVNGQGLCVACNNAKQASDGSGGKALGAARGTANHGTAAFTIRGLSVTCPVPAEGRPLLMPHRTPPRRMVTSRARRESRSGPEPPAIGRGPPRRCR